MGLTFGQRRARFRAGVALAAFNARKGQTPATITPPPTAPPSERHTLTIRRSSFQAFVRLSDREQRPVEEVMVEWLADCAALIGQQEAARDEFEGYGLALPPTPAMLRAAAAADERERHPFPDDETAAHEHAALGAGYVEITLATEGC